MIQEMAFEHESLFFEEKQLKVVKIQKNDLIS